MEGGKAYGQAIQSLFRVDARAGPATNPFTDFQVDTMSNWFLAFGLVLYPSTQLRLGAIPFGPGELMLILWAGSAILHLILLPRVAENIAFRRIGIFWFFLIVANCLGMIVGLALEPFIYVSGIVHDIFAYALVFLLACLMALDLAEAGRRRDLVWKIVPLGAVSMVLQASTGLGALSMPGVDPWFYDRLRGWSLDPNQLGFLAMFTLFLSVHLSETARTSREAVAAVACGLPALIVGLLSKSDTFVLASIVAGSVFLVLKAKTWLQPVDKLASARGTAMVLCLLFLPLSLASLAPFWPRVVDRAVAVTDTVYAEDGQGDLRLHLWREAYEKGLASGLIGYGPGPHLTSKSWKRPPPYKFEAHNTSLDLFTQGGILVLAAFAWLAASTLHDVWRAQLPALAAMVMGVVVFSMFHFVIRHPNFWFATVLCLLEAERTRSKARPAPMEVTP